MINDAWAHQKSVPRSPSTHPPGIVEVANNSNQKKPLKIFWAETNWISIGFRSGLHSMNYLYFAPAIAPRSEIFELLSLLFVIQSFIKSLSGFRTKITDRSVALWRLVLNVPNEENVLQKTQFIQL